MYLHTQQLINEIAPERHEEFSPGLDPELVALIRATAEVEMTNAEEPKS